MITKALQKQKLISKSLLIMTLGLFSMSVQAEDIALDKILAVVNNDIIMYSEVKPIALRIKQAGKTGLSDKELIKDVVDKIILNKVQIHRAKQLGITVDDATLNQALTSIAEQNKLSLDQFKVALQQEGLNYKKFSTDLRQKLYIDRLQKNYARGRQKITESAVDDLIKAESFAINKDVEYQITDILVPAPNGTPVAKFNQLLSKAQQLRKQILVKPDSANALIKRSNASQKNVGWVGTKSLSPAYIRTLSLMEEGEYSNVVRDIKGFHILKLTKQRGGNRKIIQEANVRHILISSDDPDAKLKATQIRQKIIAGGDFSKLAQAHSADKGSARNGGDLGMRDPSAYVPPFANAVKTLPLNTLSQPIKTKFGWHLIQVLERNANDQTRKTLKAQAEAALNKREQSADLKNWLQGLKDQAYIEYRL